MSVTFLGLISRDIKVFIVVMVCSVSLAGISSLYFKSKRDEKSTVERTYIEIKNKFDEAVNSRKRIAMFKSRFIKLKNLGIDGEENRLNWIDIIESTTERSGIPYVKYKIGAQALSDDKALGKKYENIDIYKSIMDLEMHLLHEGDLYVLTGELDKKAKGLFDINSCEITRIKKTVVNLVMDSNSRNFIAKCSLSWYTMKDRGV